MSTQKKNKTYKKIVEKTKFWPIVQLFENRNKFMEDVSKKTEGKIQKKIPPDISPETSRLSAIVNEAKEIVLKDIS